MYKNCKNVKNKNNKRNGKEKDIKIIISKRNMNINKMKNVVVLKNLPSNIIDEAIVILKQNKKAIVFEKNSRNNANGKDENIIKNDYDSQDYIVREAEMIIQDYITDEREKNNNSQDLQDKYLKLRKVTIGMGIALIVTLCISITVG